MKAKKIPYWLFLGLLTIGASLILGFLSFGGMFALWPILPLAFGALALSVAYEGEIYFQNIRGAFNKLFKRDYLKHYLANEFLLKNFPDIKEDKCPEFFKDYQAQLKLLHKFDHKTLDDDSKLRKKAIEKTLKDMEKWFAEQLFAGQSYTLKLHYTTKTEDPEEPQNPRDDEVDHNRLYLYRMDEELEYAVRTLQGEVKRIRLPSDFEHHSALLELMDNPAEKLSEEQLQALFKFSASKGHPLQLASYQEELQDWLVTHKKKEAAELFSYRTKVYYGVKAFSLLAGFFMGLGTTYLLVGEFAAIPILATIPFGVLPAIILPMAIIAGLAYSLLIFNAVTDMINNDSLRKWYYKIRDDFKNGITFRNVFMTLTTVVLIGLAVALTICTAGTWWTVAKNARPLFGWMVKIPGFVMGLINPVITGISALIFNIQNTKETFDLVDEMAQGNIFQRTRDRIVDGFNKLRKHENWWQILNPFRLLLKITIAPLRALLFLGHLVSIGVTADRVPGIPVVASALLGIISEGFEDLHYFVDHDHDDDEHHHHSAKDLLEERLKPGHTHDHSGDIPSRILIALFSPIYAAAAAWDLWFSTKNANTDRPVLEGFWAAWRKQHGEKEVVAVELSSAAKHPSQEWVTEHTLYRIERQATRLNNALFNRDIATQKAEELTELKTCIRAGSGVTSIREFIADNANKEIYNKHRFFGKDDSRTSTKKFLDELPERVCAPAA